METIRLKTEVVKVSDGHSVRFTIGTQSFYLKTVPTPKEARYQASLLEIAFGKIKKEIKGEI